MTQTILVVDDEIKLRDMMRVYLEQEGYRVVEAGHGREARDFRWVDRRFSLCLCHENSQ